MQRQDSARLFYLVGASGAGKDTLIDYCRARLPPTSGIRIARRYITRPVIAGGETHIALTEAEFRQRRNAGQFALHWQANGFCYGIGVEINAWLAQGMGVLVNGSRAHAGQARQCYAQRLLVVQLQVASTTLQARLGQRGREDAQATAARLRRSARLQHTATLDGLVIDNNGAIADAGQRLLAILTSTASRTIP